MIKRKLFIELKEHLSQKEVSLIVGPRQAGKTTIMLALKKDLETTGKKTIYFNLDIETDRKFFTSQAAFIDKIKLEIGEESGYVFVDEIQRKVDAGLFLKGIYDMSLPYKFIVSGSGSVALKEKIHESLAGRKRLFEFSTVSFEEFVQFKTEYRYVDKLSSFFALEPEKTKALAREYINFGGYPRVVLAETVEEKRKIIREIYESYIEKDIRILLDVQNTDAFSNLITVLSSQIGSLVTVSELSSTLGIAAITVNNYLWYLQNTYIVDKVTPFFTNTRKEITKSPLFYFNDLGLRNYAIGIFGNDSTRMRDAGFLFENFIFNILKEQEQHSSAKIHYWRTKDRAEVDFVLRRGVEIIPIESKYKVVKEGEVTRSFRSFLSKYAPSNGYIIHLGGKGEKIVGKTKVSLLPFYALGEV